MNPQMQWWMEKRVTGGILTIIYIQLDGQNDSQITISSMERERKEIEIRRCWLADSSQAVPVS